MNSSILFGINIDNEKEYHVANKYFKNTMISRNILPLDSLIIGRYGIVPFYEELSLELKRHGSKLINTYDQHKYIEKFKYYNDIKDITFKTWFHEDELPNDKHFIVKGTIDSKKYNKYGQFTYDYMYARNKDEAIKLKKDLQNNPAFTNQNIIFREYMTLDILEDNVNECYLKQHNSIRIFTEQETTMEWRCFIYKDRPLVDDFYWIDKLDILNGDDYRLWYNRMKIEMFSFLRDKVIPILKHKLNFYTVDIAKLYDGEYKVVDVNDGQMSELRNCDPHELYSNLFTYIEEDNIKEK